MSNQNMMCDLETGLCGIGDEDTVQEIDLTQLEKKVTLYYATDPICSHCWALEPVMNRFVEEYGQYFNVQIVMGGLLANWNGFADGGNGIQKPSDVEHHWKEVGEYSRMPIDGSLWRTNPILSSYPPSRVFKVIQSKKVAKEIEFLRRAREAVFSFNRNIGEEEVLIDIVNQLGLNGEQIVDESCLESAQDLLEEDFQLASRLGVRGFPTIIMANEENKGVKIVGARSLEAYVQALQQIIQVDPMPQKISSLQEKMNDGHLLFSKEIEVIYGIEKSDVEAFIKSELPDSTYRIQIIMDEMYVERL